MNLVENRLNEVQWENAVSSKKVVILSVYAH